jgi:UDP-N-acetylglucosamine 4,6-dehydratase
MFKDKSVLITGGTGSIGKVLIDKFLNSPVRRIIIFSRDELKQYDLRAKLGNDSRFRWFIGDIRDVKRLKLALHNVDYVIHAAALKQVDAGEYNPSEFIKTNIIGSQNIIEASMDAGVKKVIALSTDKASSPINLYGATKLTADKLFISANNYSLRYGTEFSVVRYGNVMGSRGSIIPFFRKLAEQNLPIPITDKRMTRFWITLDFASEFILDSFRIMQGGELYVPKIPSMRIIDLALAIGPDSKLTEIGIRPGEKLHEEMISSDDSRRTTILRDRFVINPVIADWGYKEPDGLRMPENTPYRSDTNDQWLSRDDIKAFIENEVFIND